MYPSNPISRIHLSKTILQVQSPCFLVQMCWYSNSSTVGPSVELKTFFASQYLCSRHPTSMIVWVCPKSTHTFTPKPRWPTIFTILMEILGYPRWVTRYLFIVSGHLLWPWKIIQHESGTSRSIPYWISKGTQRILTQEAEVVPQRRKTWDLWRSQTGSLGMT